jgi:hypothetical protein
MGAVDKDKVAGEAVFQLAAVGGARPRGGKRLRFDLSDLWDVGLGHRAQLVASQSDH